MLRRFSLCLPVLMGACRRTAPPTNLLPETVASIWHRTALEAPPVSAAPDPISRTSIDWFQTAAYQGPGKIETRIYGLTSSAVALEMVQRWRPSADTVFFYSGKIFVVLKWQDADRKALEAFIRELQSRLGKG
jgi:hypothetical protein